MTEAGRTLQPELLAARRIGSRHEFDLRVPADLAVWPGHFPEFFVVPGVLQVDWVLRFAGAKLGLAAAPSRIEGLKFKTPLRPQQRFTLHLEIVSAQLVTFQLSELAEVFSLGRLHFDGALP